jgi:hypothetical protein
MSLSRNRQTAIIAGRKLALTSTFGQQQQWTCSFFRWSMFTNYIWWTCLENSMDDDDDDIRYIQLVTTATTYGEDPK